MLVAPHPRPPAPVQTSLSQDSGASSGVGTSTLGPFPLPPLSAWVGFHTDFMLLLREWAQETKDENKSPRDWPERWG